MKRLKELSEYLNNLKELKGLDNRVSLLQLNDLVSDFLGFDIEFTKLTTETDDFRLGLDLYLFNEKMLYINIYYLLDNNGMLFITDYHLSGVPELSDNDYNQLIIQSDQDLLSKNSAYAFYIDNIDRFDEIASILGDHDRVKDVNPHNELRGWFYTLIDEIKNVKQEDYPLGA